jgi:uncharacterized protein (TIGR00299 family) protein
VEGIGLEVQAVRRHGLRARRAVVTTAPSPHHRTLSDVLAVLDAASTLPEPVRAFGRSVFERLATAEARVHGVAPDEVHFHEVGALDAIADVVGCGLALDSLGLSDTTVVVSHVAVGSGSVRTDHGRLPVPAPAVLELLTAAGAPVAAHSGDGELCTPTGAALLTTLAHRYGPMPAMTPSSLGVGAGTADPAGHANVVRVVVGTPHPADRPLWTTSEMVLVEATVDDLDPRLWPDVLHAMRAPGPAAAWCVPVLTRHCRPGHTLTVLTTPDYVDSVCRGVFRHTSTLGLRMSPVTRRALPRDRIPVDYGGVEVSVKRGHLDGTVVVCEPEYDEVRRAADATGASVREVLAAVRAAAWRGDPSAAPPAQP